METLLTTLPWIQIILAVILTVAILLQQRGAGIGGAFGGSDSSVHYERRGSEKTLFRATIVLSILFVLSALVQVIIIQSITPDYIPTNNTDISPETDASIDAVELEGENIENISVENTASEELENLLLDADNAAQ